MDLIYYDLEGGFWGLTDDKGRNWLPLNLDESWYAKGNIKVIVSFIVNENVVSFVNWGKPIEILEIREA
jgi:hypothetical protein